MFHWLNSVPWKLVIFGVLSTAEYLISCLWVVRFGHICRSWKFTLSIIFTSVIFPMDWDCLCVFPSFSPTPFHPFVYSFVSLSLVQEETNRKSLSLTTEQLGTTAHARRRTIYFQKNKNHFCSALANKLNTVVNERLIWYGFWSWFHIRQKYHIKAFVDETKLKKQHDQFALQWSSVFAQHIRNWT